MRTFESLSIIVMLVGLAWSFIPERRRARFVLYLPVLLWALLIVHFIAEGARWQMVPAYVFAAGLTLNNLRLFLRKKPSRPTSKFVTLLEVVGMMVVFFIVYQIPVLVPVFNLPEPNGPYKVGVSSTVLVDASRPETFTAAADDRREVPLRIWYPAEPPAKSMPVHYWSNHPEYSRYLTAEIGVPSFILDHLKLVKTHSFPDAPLAAGQSTWPVILFSHGYRLGYLEQNTTLMETLASNGFVVISVGHPYEAIAVPLADGSTARYLDTNKTAFFNSEAVQEESLQIWSADERFVLDQFGNIAQESPLAFLAGRLDLSRLGVAGMSFGGSTAAQLCQTDARCKAVLTLDSPQYTAVKSGKLTQPYMQLVSDNGAYLERRVYEQAAGPAWLVTVKGTEHYNFSDLTLVSPLLSALKFSGPINGPQMVKIIDSYSLAFFEKALKDLPNPLLIGISAQYPEVTIESRQP